MRRLHQKGISLVAAVMLIVFASVAVLGIVVFIAQRFKQYDAEEVFLKAIYLAQAGINQSVYYYRFNDIAANGYFPLGKTNIDANNFFVIGPKAGETHDAYLLMVNRATTTLTIGSGNRNVANWQLQNATDSRTITIDKINVTWNNSRNLTRIVLDGTIVWTGTLAPPGGTVTLSPKFTLNTTPTLYTNNYFRFNNSMNIATVNANFFMLDGSSTGSMQIYPALNYNTFTVESTGKTAGSNIFRTIVATYNANTGKIIDWDEINTEITP